MGRHAQLEDGRKLSPLCAHLGEQSDERLLAEGPHAHAHLNVQLAWSGHAGELEHQWLIESLQCHCLSDQLA